MKKIFTLIMLVPILGLFSQGSENFDNASLTTSYLDGSFTGNNGIDWIYTHSRNEGAAGIDGNGIMLRRPDEPSSLSATFTGGIGNLSFDSKKAFTGNGERQLEILVNSVPIDTFLPNYANGADPDVVPYSFNINIEGTINLEFRLVGPDGNTQMVIDNIVWSGFTSSPIADTTVAFTSTSASIVENIGTYNLTLALNQAIYTNKTVDIVLSSGNGALVDGFTSETVTFSAGGALSETVTLNIVEGLVSGSEVLTFELQNPSAGLDLGANNEFELTVNELVSAPLYDIATVRGNNTDGAPDSLGVECRLTGTVLGVNLRDNGLEFTIHDGTAGIGVFAPAGANTFGYSVSEGDSIEVQGEIAVFRGLAQIGFLQSLNVIGSGTVPNPTVVTELNESTESELVTLENVTVLNQGAWNQGNSFNLEVYNATDTFTIRVNDQTDVAAQTIPGCELTITGVGSQFASSTSAPFEDGYRIIPMNNADIQVLAPCPDPGTTSIFDIQFTAATSGDSPLNGQIVTTSGIVSSVRPGGTGTSNVQGFYLQDGDGPWNGIFVFNNTFTVEEGDSIEITATVTESFNQTELEFVSDVTILSSGNEVKVTEVSTEDVNTEPYEGVLVKVVNATCTNDNAGFGQFEVNDGSGACLVDDDIYEYPNPTQGVVYSVTGPVRYSFSEYKIEPRRDSDIEVGANVDYPLYEIQEVTTIDNDGIVDSLGVQAKLIGTVLGVNLRSGGLEFTIHDGTGGIGVFAPAGANTFGYTVTEGDLIEVQGEITQFRGLAQIAFLQSLSATGIGTLPTPTVVTSLGEATESELVKFENVTLADPSEWPAPGSNAKNIIVSLNGGGTIDVRIFPQSNIAADLSAPDGVFDLIGIGSQFSSSTNAPFNDGYRLIPRYKEDFDGVTSINNTMDLVDFNAYPNPVSNVLNLEFDYSANEAALIQIYDVRGKLILNTGTILNNGYNKINLSTENINAGYYFVRVLSDKGSYTTNIIKQ